jgi:hypothetical protein
MMLQRLAYFAGYHMHVEDSKWLAHLPFTSKAAGSSLSGNFLNATRTQTSCEKSKSQHSAESRGFSPGTPVSWLLPQGKLTGCMD